MTIEAHPKIASMPFVGANVFQFSVRPPPTDVGGVVQVSFQFTCRSGIVVQVLGQDDHVDVLVLFNSADYVPPPLPERHTYAIPRDQLGDASDLISLEQFVSLFEVNKIATAITEQALARGIDTDRYDVPDVDPLDRSHAVPFVHVNQIPAGQQASSLTTATASPIRCSASSKSAGILPMSSVTRKASRRGAFHPNTAAGSDEDQGRRGQSRRARPWTTRRAGPQTMRRPGPDTTG